MIIPKKLRDEYLEKAKKTLTDKQTTENIWDPTGKIPTKEKLIQLNRKTKAQQLYIEENLDEIRRKRKKQTIANAILIPLTIILFILNSPLSILSVLGLVIANILLNNKNINKVKKDIIKLELAQKNNYLYDPEENPQRYNEYKQKFPEAFKRGDTNQNIEDVFWGTNTKNNKKHYFTTGIFNYSQYEGSGKHRRLVHYTDHYFAIKLPNQIKTRFSLVPNNKLLNLFSNKKIKTESKKFNDTYTTKYEGKKQEHELEITRILSPKAQEEILNLNEHNKERNSNIYKTSKQASGTTIILDKETILFYLPGTLMKKMKTTFTKNTKIHEEDLHEIKNELNTLINISTEITKYIN